MNIIGECAKWNFKALDAFLCIAEGKLPDFYNKSSFSQNSNDDSSVIFSKKIKNEESGIKTWKWEIGCVYVEILTIKSIRNKKKSITW
jgi:hypothetical protein